MEQMRSQNIKQELFLKLFAFDFNSIHTVLSERYTSNDEYQHVKSYMSIKIVNMTLTAVNNAAFISTRDLRI